MKNKIKIKKKKNGKRQANGEAPLQIIRYFHNHYLHIHERKKFICERTKTKM